MTVFTDTWNAAFEAIPADSEDASLGASRIRQTREAVAERLVVDHSWAGDADDGKHKVARFKEQASDPATEANFGMLYTKDVSGVTEFYWKDSAGTITQLTEAGVLISSGKLETEASLSGTEQDITAIPSWATEIQLMILGLQTNGASKPGIQLGHSGGFVTSGYIGTATQMAGSNASNALVGSFRVNGGSTWASSIVVEGMLTLTLENTSNNTWLAKGIFARTDAVSCSVVAGRIALPGALTQLRVTMDNGTDTFTAGLINARIR